MIGEDVVSAGVYFSVGASVLTGEFMPRKDTPLYDYNAKLKILVKLDNNSALPIKCSHNFVIRDGILSLTLCGNISETP